MKRDSNALWIWLIISGVVVDRWCIWNAWLLHCLVRRQAEYAAQIVGPYAWKVALKVKNKGMKTKIPQPECLWPNVFRERNNPVQPNNLWTIFITWFNVMFLMKICIQIISFLKAMSNLQATLMKHLLHVGHPNFSPNCDSRLNLLYPDRC